MLNIVLLEPEIPANTGNIGRTCVATGSRLHLIEPLGFQINEKQLRRAGMDYWKDLDVTVYDNFADFLERNPECRGKLYMATTKAKHVYTDVAFEEDAYIMFGKESAGFSLNMKSSVCVYRCLKISVPSTYQTLWPSCFMRPSDSRALNRCSCSVSFIGFTGKNKD